MPTSTSMGVYEPSAAGSHCSHSVPRCLSHVNRTAEASQRRRRSSGRNGMPRCGAAGHSMAVTSGGSHRMSMRVSPAHRTAADAKASSARVSTAMSVPSSSRSEGGAPTAFCSRASERSSVSEAGRSSERRFAPCTMSIST
eukprot:2535288-Prymnesium_polylepis.1